MSVRRVTPLPDSHFVMIANGAIRDAALSWRARGLLTYLLSLPDGWDVSADRLATQGTEGRKAVQAALRELESAGYLRRVQARESGGFKGYDHEVSDVRGFATAGRFGTSGDLTAGPLPSDTKRASRNRPPIEDGLQKTEQEEGLSSDSLRSPDDNPLSGSSELTGAGGDTGHPDEQSELSSDGIEDKDGNVEEQVGDPPDPSTQRAYDEWLVRDAARRRAGGGDDAGPDFSSRHPEPPPQAERSPDLHPVPDFDVVDSANDPDPPPLDFYEALLADERARLNPDDRSEEEP